ncbi:MAG TPA: hypothetical protein VMV45_20925, partial [Casimicrobiaceae bacterium]|nr:hypothetical protein [Casimicrobiaceae bacterium]
LTGGAWGWLLRPPLEAAALTLPLLGVFGIPLLLALPQLFSWARSDALAHDAILQAKQWYLNQPAFIARNVVWLVLWSALAMALRRHLDADAETRSIHAGRRIAVAGLLVYLVSVTLAAFDWIASLTPEWYSTAIGIRWGAAQFVAAFAFAVPFAVLQQRLRRGAIDAAPHDFQDLGNLLLTFTMTWAYFAFAQYLIVWAEDLPRETSWYWPRTQTTWQYLGLTVFVLNFAVPTLAMLFRPVKRNGLMLASLCLLVLAGQWLDAFWLVAPSLRPGGLSVSWLDVTVLVAQGGLWMAAVAILVQRIPVPSRIRQAVVTHG